MLTASEMPAVEGALNELRAALARADAVVDALPWWRSVIPGGGYEGDQAIVAADRMRVELAQLVRERNALVEAPGYDHEAALSIVERARRAAGLAAAADAAGSYLADPVGSMQGNAAATADAVADAVAPVVDAGGWLLRNWRLVAAVVLLVLLAPYATAAARLVPRRGDAS